ncbi:MAG: hypothetical protein EBR27_05645 [Betaproteobacteria bacterium]|nr:hypothetical protein [Betaproteobacteria bacterium]
MMKRKEDIGPLSRCTKVFRSAGLKRKMQWFWGEFICACIAFLDWERSLVGQAVKTHRLNQKGFSRF